MKEECSKCRKLVEEKTLTYDEILLVDGYFGTIRLCEKCMLSEEEGY